MAGKLSQEEIDMLVKGADPSSQTGLGEGQPSPADVPAATGETAELAGPTEKPAAVESQAHTMAESEVAVSPEAIEPPTKGSHSDLSGVRPMVYEELEPEEPPVPERPVAGLGVLMDVPLSVSVELGRARCYVKDLLNMTAGSVIELDRSAGDMVDVLVNGKLFARGEVVVIDESFGVRIHEIVRKSEGERPVVK